MFDSTDAECRGLWRVGISRNAVFFHSCVASKEGSQSQLPKTGVAEDQLLKMSTKFAPHCGEGAIWKSKSLKHRGFGALLEVELRKICTVLWRESD